MDLYEAFAQQSAPVSINPGSTSFFSAPSEVLDPRLIRNNKVIPAVREAVLSALYGHLSKTYSSPESWTNVWLAGSGVSHQWAAHRDPGDLDCLIGVDYPTFRQANDRFKGLSNQEIASTLNEGFRLELHPLTNNFLGSFELTFYVNVQSDITKIKPYAAYSLTADDWTVEPVNEHAKIPTAWENKAERDVTMAYDIIDRYQQSLNALSAAQNLAARVNAENTLKLAASQGSALFEDIHKGRSAAFSESGSGYSDYANFRWQYGKEKGVVQALRQLHDVATSSQKAHEASLYGAELPSASTLIRRAVSQYRG